MAKLVLILGSNLGDKLASITKAKNQLAPRLGTILKESSFYISEAWGMENLSEEELFFVNKVLVIQTEETPLKVLDIIQEIESAFGRIRNDGVRYASRSIDIDILFYDDNVFQNERLTIPHPQIAARKFVLLPLSEIIPEFNHPIYQENICKLLLKCPDKLLVERI